MPNYHSIFSAQISGLTPAERAWLEAELAPPDELEAGPLARWQTNYPGVDPHEFPGFDWAFEDEGQSLWLYAEESFYPQTTALFLQRFLEAHRPHAHFALEWAETCSRPVIGSFGGGAAYITARRILWMSTGGWLAAQALSRRARIAARFRRLLKRFVAAGQVVWLRV